MADSEELRLRRIQEHEKRMSRIFDEVMGLGDFADSSRGSGSSSKSDHDETKAVKDNQTLAEEDSFCSRPEDKVDEEVDDTFPRIASFSSNPPSSFNLGASAGSGGAALDNAMDALPSGGVDDEDWDFTLPSKSSQSKEGKSEIQSDTFAGDSREVEEEEDNESTSSDSTLHSSQDNSPENSRDVINQSEETEDSQQPPPQTTQTENTNPPLSPKVDIKEEPIDEEYDNALLPQNSIQQIKEELEHEEEELRISSVYSVGGSNAFAHPSVPPAAPAPAPAPVQAPVRTPTTIFIPGRGTVLQAMTPLTIRPHAPIPSTLPILTPMAPRPPPPTIPGGVRCSGCSKILLKGQTAFQRKGSTQLFCSTVCLTGHLPLAGKNKLCFQCHKEILLPSREMVTISAENNTYINFCGQFCLSVFRHKQKSSKNVTDKRVENKLPQKPVDRPPEKLFCSVCKLTDKIEHEVNHQGSLHRLCSDACFVTWRKLKQLALNCCEGCGLYCNSNSDSCQTLMINKSELNFCSPTCISTYKQTCKKTSECACCHKVVVVCTTAMERDQKGKVQLYCSTLCVEKSRPSKHILSDAAFPCSHCKVTAVPQYHLAMVDGTIRNFCSYNCVTTFRKASHSPTDLTNGTSSSKDSPNKDAPKSTTSNGKISNEDPHSIHNYYSRLSPTVISPVSHNSEIPSASERGPAPSKTELSIHKLSCYHCKKQFRTKPQLLSHKGSISVFCSDVCCTQYKIQKNIVASCEFCKQEKVLYEMITNNQETLAFCSEACKILFKKEMNLNHPWHPCSYCSGFCEKMLHSHYGGKMEEFCKSYCMSQYTVLYYGMARCDSCRRQGYMTENLGCMGSVRNFCNMACLLHYCYTHFETEKHSISNGISPESPKVNGTPVKSNKSIQNLDHASTQTDAMHVPIPRRRPMKNKTILCRPITMDQEVSCQLLEPPDSAAPLDSQHPSKSTAEASTSTPASPSLQEETQACSGVPARLSGRHFLGKRDADNDCKVCSQYKRKRPEEDSEEERKRQKLEENVNEEDVVDETEEDSNSNVKNLKGQTTYYCKTCPGEPSLCPVPCFELYHTRLIYKTVHEGVLPLPTLSPEEDKVRVVMVPVPVPVFIPVPMNMYSQHTPVPMPMPLPVPVPMVVPPEKKDMKDCAVQYECIGTSDEVPCSSTDENRHCDKPEPDSSCLSPVINTNNETEETTTTSDPDLTNPELEPPSSPIMDLEADFSPGALDQKEVAAQRGVKRPRESHSRKRARRRTSSGSSSTVIFPLTKLNHLYGISAWKSWVRQRNRQPNSENPLPIEEDIFQCDSHQLSSALCRFIREVRRPNGETYSPDSIFYLCLGLQQYLFLKDRIENIFTDQLYSGFASDMAEMLKQRKPSPVHSGAMISCVEESFLWECKQLGAYSPIVLLNTLLFFFTKNFGFVTVEQHQSLSFASINLCSKHCSKAGRVSYLQFRRSSSQILEETERLGKRKREEEENMELLENVANPLHCPVRLYEFYLSRCPETVKRSDPFYLQPEKDVHTDSSYWYACQPLEKNILQSMLSLILAVREVQQYKDEN